MENKKTTPILTVIFYLLGLIFLVISAFMLYAGISYTKVYLATYDLSFTEMWSNSIQYIIEKFVPYFGFGVISLGVGKAIKEARNSAVADVQVPEINVPDAKVPETLAKTDDVEAAVAKVKEVAQNLEEFKVVSNIKLEEMEKRQSFRLKEARDIINDELIEHMAARAAAEDLIIRLLGSSTDEIKDISEFRKEVEDEAAEEAEALDEVPEVEDEAVEEEPAEEADEVVEEDPTEEAVEEEPTEETPEPEAEEAEAETAEEETETEETEVPDVAIVEIEDEDDEDELEEEEYSRPRRRVRRFVK